jgi:2-methylcitrate dehydratase PrpD
VDRFIHIIEDNDLRPEDIEKVKVIEWKWGITSLPFCSENQLETKEDICFNTGYLLACAAYYRHHIARWCDSEVFHDPKVREFMRRVKKIKEPDQSLLGIEVITKGGKIFMTKEGCGCVGGVCGIKPEEKAIRGGMELPEEERKEELLDKFINNVSRTFSSNESNEIAQTVLELEKLENMGKLMRILAP